MFHSSGICHEDMIGSNHHIIESHQSFGGPVGSVNVTLDITVQIGYVHQVVVVIGFHNHVLFHRNGYIASFPMYFRMFFTNDFQFSCHHVPFTDHLIERIETGRLDDMSIAKCIIDIYDAYREQVGSNFGFFLVLVSFWHGDNTVHVVAEYLVFT